MKRSEINQVMRDSLSMMQAFGFALPPFATWSPADWEKKGHECDEIRDNMLGWDITDWGMEDFQRAGLVLITLRNGNQNNPKYKKPYAEKILISRENQITPMHFHWYKTEDIINRGGGTLMMKLYHATAEGGLSDADVQVVQDGVKKNLPAGAELEIPAGCSVTIEPGVYHSFWAREGDGPVLIGEVSQCNDDNTDNRFYDAKGRFPAIEEDEPPLYLLCNEYPVSP